MSADQQGSLLLKRQLAGMWSPFFLVKTTVLFVRCLCQCNANSMASFSFTRTHQASYGRLFCWSYRRWESFEMGIDGGWTPGHFLVSFSQKCLCCRDIQWPSLIIVHACNLPDICVKLNFVVLFAVCCSEGGLFKAHLYFPKEYPQRPPKMRFISEFWHPNGEYVMKLVWFFKCVYLSPARCFSSLFCVVMLLLKKNLFFR